MPLVNFLYSCVHDKLSFYPLGMFTFGVVIQGSVHSKLIYFYFYNLFKFMKEVGSHCLFQILI